MIASQTNYAAAGGEPSDLSDFADALALAFGAGFDAFSLALTNAFERSILFLAISLYFSTCPSTRSPGLGSLMYKYGIHSLISFVHSKQQETRIQTCLTVDVYVVLVLRLLFTNECLELRCATLQLLSHGIELRYQVGRHLERLQLECLGP